MQSVTAETHAAEAPATGNPGSEKERVITKATLNAGENLKLTGPELAKIIGVSTATLSRLKKRKAVLKDGTKDQEMALYFVRVFRSLGALYGGNIDDMANWLRVENKTLRTAPIEKMKSTAGLVRTMDYLDHFRAKV